ncbi:class B sortase [Oceanobacillus polygoni]|uniref:Sortase B n=1 Tax=Oceanobacillus polygoni TaxID=1235259 RepID=A0A9X0YX45_9BACI|nr:sortase B [Oceanobacillus polygoni]
MSKQKQHKNKPKSMIQRLITIVCLVIFIASAFYLVDALYDYYTNRQVLADIQDVYRESKEDEIEIGPTDSVATIRSSFRDILAINSDIVGWVTMDGTMVDYPILQAEDNAYYLQRNYKEEDSRAGSIFMDYRNDITQQDRNIILYGHNMKDGSMFGQMKRFLDEDFLQEHQHFYFDTLYGSYEVEIFSVYHTTTDFYYIETDFPNDESYRTFLDDIKKRSEVTTDIELNAEDQIITLSTCDYLLDPNEGRLVIHGKLVKQN